MQIERSTTELNALVDEWPDQYEGYINSAETLPLGFEPRLSDSESKVLTTTLWEPAGYLICGQSVMRADKI